MKFKISFILIIGFLISNLYADNSSIDSTKSHYFSIPFSFYKSNYSFNYGKLNKWEVSVNFDMENIGIDDISDIDITNNSIRYFVADSLGNFEEFNETYLSEVKSTVNYTYNKEFDFDISLKKIINQKEKNDYTHSFYTGIRFNFDYDSHKYNLKREINGYEFYMNYPDDISEGDVYGEFWNSDTIVVWNDDVYDFSSLSTTTNFPVGVKLERKVPLIKSQNIFVEIDATLFSPYLLIENSVYKINRNQIYSYNNGVDDKDFRVTYGIIGPSLNLYLKYFF